MVKEKEEFKEVGKERTTNPSVQVPTQKKDSKSKKVHQNLQNVTTSSGPSESSRINQFSYVNASVNLVTFMAYYLPVVSCPLLSFPECYLDPAPFIPNIPTFSDSMIMESSSKSYSNHRYNLRSLANHASSLVGGIGISSHPMPVKLSRGSKSHLSKAIHKAIADVAKGCQMSIDRVLRENSNPGMVTR